MFAPAVGTVLYDFETPAPDEIALRAGEVITVLECDDGGWWRGEKASGEVGLFPFNYVSLLKEEEEEERVSPDAASGEAASGESSPRPLQPTKTEVAAKGISVAPTAVLTAFISSAI